MQAQQSERLTRLTEAAREAAEASITMREAFERVTHWTQVDSRDYRPFHYTNINLIGEENDMPEDVENVEASTEERDPRYAYCRCGERVSGPDRNHTRQTTSGGSERCTACTFTCASCYSIRTRNNRWGREVSHPSRPGRTEWFCTDCIQSCGACGEPGARTWMVYWESQYYPSVRGETGWYCRTCMSDCPNCSRNYSFPRVVAENYAPEDEYDEEELTCHRCNGGRGSGIIGYQHTVPFIWLGGPVKAQGGYYLGFELEISASSGTSAQPIHKWAKKHLGHRDALQCKMDSSVRGFEIVSQPMTPEFFESVDWDSLFTLLNDKYPIGPRGQVGEEPREHGLHVHVGRNAFHRNDLSTAAFSYLLSQGDYLDKIARRAPYHYCEKVAYPVRATLSQSEDPVFLKQRMKAQNAGIYAGRHAINLGNEATVEIRAFKSTRKADDLRAAMRVTYMAAEYIRHLRADKKFVPPKALHWSEFLKWAAWAYPDKADVIITPNAPTPVRQDRKVMVTTEYPEANVQEFEREPLPERRRRRPMARAGQVTLMMNGQELDLGSVTFEDFVSTTEDDDLVF